MKKKSSVSLPDPATLTELDYTVSTGKRFLVWEIMGQKAMLQLWASVGI